MNMYLILLPLLFSVVSIDAAPSHKRFIGLGLGWEDIADYLHDRIEDLNEAAHKDRVCYKGYGCFDLRGPFASDFWDTGVMRLLPQSPKVVNTTFTLYTRKNPKQGQRIGVGRKFRRKNNFKKSRNTVIILHGFLQNGKVWWMDKMKDVLLSAGDYNVITVDWHGGSRKYIYWKAAANSRIVGVEMARLIRKLAKLSKDYRNFHIIGHSLGAHAAGYAGESLKTLGRISGLDPARPSFEGQDARTKLDPTDAEFVDVIHTDTSSWYANIIGVGGFGTRDVSGHVDFYPNGGETQPGCSTPVTSFFDKLKYHDYHQAALMSVACDHGRAIELYIDSIKPECQLTAYMCDSYEEFQAGKCSNCTESDSCRQMGFYSDKPKLTDDGKEKVYFMDTSRFPPFCDQERIKEIDAKNE